MFNRDESRYGVDVSSVRLDYLDKELLRMLQSGQTVLDLGAGKLGLSRECSNKGAKVTAVDLQPQNVDFCEYHQNDVKEFVVKERSSFDYVVAQRVIHYMRYGEALRFLKDIRKLTSQLYVSVTGIESAVADHTKQQGDLHVRYAPLDVVGKEKFNINQPVCLYSRTEFCKLLSESGWTIQLLRSTAFGNHQAICTS